MNKPEIKFVEVDIAELEERARSVCEEVLGRTITPADPVNLLIKSFLTLVVNQRVLLEWCAKQNLLAFASNERLDALGQLVGVKRYSATAAFTTVEVKLSAARETTTTIKKGTRITADNQTFFALDEKVVFLAGETTHETSATCQSVGTVGNGFAAGELNQIVDPQPFLKSIVNLTTTEGGAEEEDDESLRERIHLAPESFSCAGSRGAYVARVKEVSALIDDVAVVSPSPGRVDIYLLMQGGALPGEEIISEVSDYLNQKDIRPLTDEVRVKAPSTAEYTIAAECYIADEDKANAAEIIAAAEAAADKFIAWQSAKLGRDLNPSMLINMLMDAGIKRVDVTQPTFMRVNEVSVAICAGKSLTFHYEER